MKRISLIASLLALSVFAGCSVEKPGSAPAGGMSAAPTENSAAPTKATESTATSTAVAVEGEVKIDGSSTVFPVSQAMAEEFQKVQPKTQIVVGESGTGGGFKKFSAGEIDINDASRPISEAEAKACAEKGIEFVGLKVCIDGLSILVNPENDFCKVLTTDQLKQIWQPDSPVKSWKDINPAWPDHAIKLYGPGTASGTFDYFTEVINGKAKKSRTDYLPSEDDNVLVKGIAGDKYSLGYFGYAYYAENKDSLKLVSVASGSDPAKAVTPTIETIRNGEYSPLSRPLYIYVTKPALKRAVVQEFLRFYLGVGQKLVPEVGYVELDKPVLDEQTKVLEEAIAGAK